MKADDSVFDFPCDIPIKVLGHNGAALRDAAYAIVRDHYGELGDERFQERESRDGNYVSLTITVRAGSREEIDAVYRDLTAHSDILMVL